MSSILKDFHLPLLDDSGFKEDSVREEIIAPILRQLGYAASGPQTIQRSKSLIHPFVYIGTKAHQVHIIPDYTLCVDGKPCWILDAKAPTEDIRKGKHREQVYSYAMHKDIRVPLYALCNGRRFIIYHVSEEHPLVDISITEMIASLDPLWSVVSPPIIREPNVARFWPDLGIHHYLLGYTPADHIISEAFIDLIMRIDEDHYTISAGADMDGIDMLGSYDFEARQLPELLSILPKDIAARVKRELRNYPFHSDLRECRPKIMIYSRMGLALVENPKETFLPFFVRQFSPAITKAGPNTPP